MDFSTLRRRPRLAITGALLAALIAVAGTALGVVGDDPGYRSNKNADTPSEFGTAPLSEAGSAKELLARDAFFMSRRTAGSTPLDNQQAGALRAQAAHQAALLRKEGVPTAGPTTFSSAWAGLGPNPIAQVTRNPEGGIIDAMAGRIGALAIRKDGTRILAGAQGGIWLWDPATTNWVPKTDNAGSLAMGSLAVAPSNDQIVYAGTGEGHLSGDSYFGNGVLKSSDGGNTWTHVSGDYFFGVSISRMVVDPTNANHVFAAVLRGRGGSRRVTPAIHSRYGIWESTDGGASWTLLKEATEATGATDVELDPQNPSVLYASFWGDAIYKSTNGGTTWAPIMTGIPGTTAQHASNQTRFSLAISHPSGQDPVLYAGFDWEGADGYHPSRVFKSTNAGASWTMLPKATVTPDESSVEDYCGGQCFYDNVIEAAPDNPNVVYAAGQFDYGRGSGGIFRSDDGGQTWRDLGWDQHPDFQAFAFDPNDSNKILSGSDGGIWYSTNRGGRLGANPALNDVNWQNLNGIGLTADRTQLQIAQFTSIAAVPTVPGRFWGGTQDNGTMRKSTASETWSDVAGGDGGQVLVNPTDANFVYGTHFNISPYRFTNAGNFFFSNSAITNGIDLSDRSTFYIPMTLNKNDPSQLFLGTYRLYRTNSAMAPSAGDVKWKAISPDLTAGCAGTAPNGARGCLLSAIGVGGGQAVYTGAEDGHVFVSPNAQVSDSPTWTRVDNAKLPERPVTSFAVDKSNYRTAYIAYAGFNPSTPSRPGHVFRTKDGGQSWVNITGNLPDSPVNSIILDPSYPNTLYVGTDVGPMVTYNGGANWVPLGSGFPNVAIWQLDLDTTQQARVLVAGTHGRGAWRANDGSAPVPALVLSKVDAGVPVGPSSQMNYTLTLKNIGNADATGVTISDPLPENTSFVSASSGGSFADGKVTWNGLTVPKATGGVPGSIQVTLKISIAQALKNKVKAITNDGVVVTSAQGPGTTGSPFITPIAPPYSVTVAPATQTDGGRLGTNVDYKVTLTNLGFNADTYSLSSAGGTWTVSFLDSTCTTPLAGNATASVASGASTQVCVRVAVPAGAADSATSTATVSATSAGDAAVAGTATIKTIAVAVQTLLIDNDGNIPDVQGTYNTALSGVPHQVWDLSVDQALPLNFLLAFDNVVWFTGNSYPGPILPYQDELTSYLNAGNNLLMSGQDILDQAAGTTDFVHDYLHIDWDGTEVQNDKDTSSVHEVAGTLSAGLGTVALDRTVLGNDFEDRITPIAPATAIFTDDSGAADGLSFSGTYKVVFLAFPFEAYGTATQKTDLMNRVKGFFGP